ncbi:MAG: TIGR03013 family XrtA/PEP-CTERM system glycosyltransferase [Burkholderiales bacterium]
MSRLVRYSALLSVVLQLAVEALLYFSAVVLGVYLHRQFPQDLWTLHAYLPAFVFAFVMVMISASVGLYRTNGPTAAKSQFTKIVLATALGVPVAYMVFPNVPHGDLAQNAIGNVLLLTLAGGILWRPFFAALLDLGWFQYRVLVVGTGPEACAVEDALNRRGLTRAVIASFYPLNSARDAAIDPSRIVSPDEPLWSIARRLRVTEIIVAVREQRGGVLPLRQLLDCRAQGIKVTGAAQFLERIAGQIPLDAIKASGLIYGDGFEQGFIRALVKRTVDIVVASLLLVLASPIIVITVLAICWEKSGPIIYRQTRVGRGSKPFTLFKFRSMRVDAEVDGRPQWAQRNDSRVTPIGRFIRRTRIDELPQLFNVLRGEMSFVGPRPERPTFVNELRQRIPFYELRHSVKPGITGWAQVQFQYAATADETAKKLQFDLYYVKNNSLILDLMILLDTARVVISGDGAR